MEAKDIREKALEESSLSRVFKHFSSNNTVVILTAFRGDKTYVENIVNNKEIAETLKKEGFGYFFVDGYWIENKGEENELKVSEDSIFCIAKEEDSEKLINLAHSLANKFNQDAIFVKTKDEVFLLFKDNSKQKLSGGLKLNTIGDFYTKLRNNKKSNTFIFEGAREKPGFFYNFVVNTYLKESKNGKGN